MKLELRLLKSIQQRPGNIILRSEISVLGSKTQITEALKSLINRGVLIKIGKGIYAKTRISSLSGAVIPAASLEVLAPEILRKLGIAAQPCLTAQENQSGRSTQLPGKLVVNTGARRISRKIFVGGRRLFYENDYTGPKSPTTSLMDVDMAQMLQNGLNNAEAIDAKETKRLEEAKKTATVTIHKSQKPT